MQVSISVNVVEQRFPGGTVGGDWFIEAALADAPEDAVHSYVGVVPATTFDMADGETYVIRGGRLAAGGNLLGAMVTTQYTVGEDLAPIDTASSLSVSAVPSASKAAGKAGGKK